MFEGTSTGRKICGFLTGFPAISNGLNTRISALAPVPLIRSGLKSSASASSRSQGTCLTTMMAAAICSFTIEEHFLEQVERSTGLCSTTAPP